MSLTATTLSAAITASDTVLGVASATYITAPNFTTGAGVTLLKLDEEVMVAVSKSGTQIGVLRGQFGTQAKSHVASVPVIVGSLSDFGSIVPAQGATQVSEPTKHDAIGEPLTGATIAPTGGKVHHFTGTTQLVTITPPAGLVAGGRITLIFDGSASGLTWTTGGNIAVAGTATTAASAVDFLYDPSTGLWHPSRLA